jgi:hypothetical protein
MPPVKHNHNNSTLVKNVSGTSADRYKINNLHGKYIAAGGTTSTTCQAKGCDKTASATAHVRLTDGRRSGDWMLTRACGSHNSAHNTEPYALRANAKLVPVTAITQKK